VRVRVPLVAIGAVLLVLVTVLVFHAFDRDSHSVSDTLRPFLLTMLPIWLLAVVGLVILSRER
jgi:hypothetical protein